MKIEYWDSCIFLAYLNDEVPFGDIIQALLHRPEEILIVVSSLVLAEIQPRTDYDPERFRAVHDLFYTNRLNIRVANLTPPISELASKIAHVNLDITTPDAVHIATALMQHAEIFYTLDGARDATKNRRSGGLLKYDKTIGVPELMIPAIPIVVPVMPHNTQLTMPTGL